MSLKLSCPLCKSYLSISGSTDSNERYLKLELWWILAERVKGSSTMESLASTTFSSSKYQKLFSESMSVWLNRFRLHRPENPSEGKKILSVDDQRGLVSTFGSLRSPGFGKNLRVLSITRRLDT